MPKYVDKITPKYVSAVPNAPQASGLTKLNDPYQLNTVLDAIFNTAGLKKAYGKANVGTSLRAMWDMSVNKYIKPALKGDFGTVVKNTFMGLGEVTDTFGNVIKSLVANDIDKTAGVDYNYAKQAIDLIDNNKAYINKQLSGETTYTFYINGVPKVLTAKEVGMYRNLVNSGNTVNISKLTTGERFKASIGIGEYGRINFQSNQGNTFVDIATEILLDPATWVTLGKSAISEVVKKGADKGLRVFAKNLDDITQTVEDLGMREELRQLSVNLVNDTYRNELVTKINKIYNKRTTDVMVTDAATNKMFAQYVGDAVKSNAIYNTYKLKNIQAATNAMLVSKGMPAAALDEVVVQEALQRSMTKHVNKMTTTILSVIDVMAKVANKTQSVLMKAALTPAGIYPIYGIARKTPAVAKYISHILKNSEELYNNPFGNRKMSSFFEGSYNKERTTQVITDMLSDEQKVLYREPDYIKTFEKSALADVAFIDNWYRNITDKNYAEQIAALKEYIKTAQDMDLAELITTVDDIVKNAAQSSTALKHYVKTLRNVSEDLEFLEEAAVQAYKTDTIVSALHNLDILPSNVSSTTNIIQHAKKSLFETISASFIALKAHHPVDIVDFESCLNDIVKSTLARLEVIINDLLKVFPELNAEAVALYKALEVLLTKQVDEYLYTFHLAALYNIRTDKIDALSALIKKHVKDAPEQYDFGSAVKNRAAKKFFQQLDQQASRPLKAQYKTLINNYQKMTNANHVIDYTAEIHSIKDLIYLREHAFNATSFDALIDSYLEITTPFTEHLEKLKLTLGMTSSFSKRPANLFDGIQQIKQVNSARSKLLREALEMKGTKKTATASLTKAEQEKLKRALKEQLELSMPGAVLQERCEEVLDILQKLTQGGRYENLELLLQTSDRLLHTAADDIHADNKVKQYAFESFENKMQTFMYTPASSPEYNAAYNEITKILNNVITELNGRYGRIPSSQLDPDIIKHVSWRGSTTNAKGTSFWTIPGVGSSANKAWWQLNEDEANEAYRIYHDKLLEQGMSAADASAVLTKKYLKVVTADQAQADDAVRKQIDLIESFLNELEKRCAPTQIETTKALIESYETTFRIKQESFTSLLNILNSDDVNYVVDALRSGKLSELIRNTMGNSAFSKEMQENAKAVFAIINSFEATRNFVYRALMADLRPETREALLASVMNYWWLSTDSFKEHQAYWADTLIERMPNFTQFTQQGMRRHNLNKLMQDAEFKEAVKQAYDAAGMQVPDTELHQALSDTVASFGVLLKLAEENAAIAELIKDKIVINIDTEAMNATTKAVTNQMHQMAFVVTKNDKVLHKYSQAVSIKDIEGKGGYDNMPEHGYMLGLYDMAQHKTDGTYAPISDYTELSDKDLRKFYSSHLKKGNTAPTAKDADKLVLDTMYALYKQLEELAEYNIDTKSFNAVIAGHNIKGFDLPYIKSICTSHKLYERAANEEAYGFDLHFIDHLQIIDTLEEVKIEDFAYKLTGAEDATIRKMLFEYSEALEGNSYAKLFTAFNTADIRRIKNFISSIQAPQTKTVSEQLEKQGAHLETLTEFTEFLERLDKAKQAVVDIYKNNNCLADQSYYASVVTGVKSREYWLNFFRNELLLEEDEIIRRFGKDAENLQLSSLFAASGEYSDYAFKHELQPQKQDAWWIGTLTRTYAGDFTREEAIMQSKITAALNTYMKEAKNYEVYASYNNHMYAAVRAILGTGDFNHMRYIRTDGLNTAEQYALFRYLTNKVQPDKLKEVLMHEMTAKQADGLIALLKVGRKFSDVSDDKYLHIMDGAEDAKTLAYCASLDDSMALRKDLASLSQSLDDSGLVGSAATLQLKAMEPMQNILKELVDNIKHTAEVDRVLFYNAEKDLTNTLGKRAAQRFAASAPEDMLKWLAHNHAHVVLDMYSFDTLAEYDEFVSRVSSTAYKALNIHAVVDGANVWIYLTKDAKLRIHKNLETGEKTINANGQNIEKYMHPALLASDFTDIYDGFVNADTLQEGIDAIDFMTEGACRGSTYEMYGQTAFNKVFAQMPDEMKKEFYSVEELSGPLFWDSTPYNFSILGTLGNKQNLGIGTSGQLIRSLANATEYRMHEHGMRLVYTQAMFSKVNALQNIEIGRIITEHPADALRYFKNNPDYTIAVLVPDKHSPWGYRIKECDTKSKIGLLDAVANNGRIVSYTEFEKLYEVINANAVSSTLMRAWQTLVRKFKIGFLINPGTWSRNAIDAFIKNVQTTDSDMFSSYATAFKDISIYDKTVMQLNQLGNGHFPLPGVVKRFFKNNEQMDYDTFMTLHAFFSDPAAGSEAKLYSDLNAKSRSKYITQLLTAEQITTDEYNHQMSRQAFNQFTSSVLSPMNYIERVSRLACYQNLTKQGYTNTTALRMVEKTHFSYSTKTPFEQRMELLIPFYTFTSRNFVYWIDAMENNPAYFAIMRDVLEPALNLEQYSQEEREGNHALQRSILSGNIHIVDDYYWNLNFSFMDSLKWLTNPIGQAKGQIFSPVQAVLNVYLQNAADESYHSGKAALSNWMQNAFGLDMTEQQIRDKYQDWADEYMKLYSYKVSSEDPAAELMKWKTIEQFIPLIGSQIQRMETTGVYLNDGDGLKALLYLTGVAGKTTRWAPAPSSETKDLNSALYNLLSADEGGWNKYNQLCRVLGYEGDKISELPNPVKQTILAMLTDQVPDFNVIPVLQDDSAMRFMWTALKTKYDVSGVTFADIPKDKLQSMYKEIAESTVTMANIYDMLDQDELSRISYSVVKKNLGLTGLKIYQMPLEALTVLEAAMKAHLYVYVRTPQTSSGSYRRYAKKTYTGAESPGYFAGYDGVTPYDTSKGVYANYGQNWAQKQGQHNYLDFYRDMYGANGTNKMQMNMYKISPQNFKYRMKDMFYYYR